MKRKSQVNRQLRVALENIGGSKVPGNGMFADLPKTYFGTKNSCYFNKNNFISHYEVPNQRDRSKSFLTMPSMNAEVL